MLGSPILDVAIGMAFIYLLLSLIASAAQEILSSIIQARSANLERGLRSMLSNDNVATDETFVSALYNHGLVRGLYQTPSKDYKENSFRKFTRLIFGKLRLALRLLLGMKVPGKDSDIDLLLLPAYIPSRVFALAMKDILSRPMQGAGLPAPAADPAANTQTAADDSAKESDLQTAATSAGSSRVALRANQPSAEDLDAYRQIVANLGSLVTQMTKDGSKKNLAAEALLALVKDSGGNPKKLQANLEDWYNDTMDRVSGWYKRYVQNVLLVIGLALAVLLNVDSLRVAQALWFDKDARAGLVTAAGDYLQTHSNAPASASSDAAATNLSPEQLRSNLQGTVDTFNNVAKNSLVPVGWKYGFGRYRDSFHQEPWVEIWKRFLLALLGWVITAVALSYGAPFWFDTLNKFMVVRSTVKPREKSQVEPSKA